MASIRGRVWLFGDDLNTDVIHPPEFFSLDPEKVKRGLFSKLDASIQPRIQQGDVIVAGRNFGCGSSRETSIRSLLLNGIGAVVAVDFARIFFRNATNNGLPCLVLTDADKLSLIRGGQGITISTEKGILETSAGDQISVERPSRFVQQIWSAGGLLGLLPKSMSSPDAATSAGSKRMAQALVVLSWRGRWEEALRAAVSDPFERESGIRVEHLRHVGLALPESLSSALNSGGAPPVHIAWSNSVPALQAVDAGHCVPLVPERMAMLRQLRRRAHPEGCSGFPIVHPYVVHYVLGYRRDAFPGAPPKSWNILREKRHQGKIALYPGGNGFYPIAQHMAGGGIHGIPQKMEPCWSYMRQLRDAVGLLDYSIGMEQQFKDRSLDLCFRALPNMLAFADAGAAVNWTVPEEGTTDTLDALWIPQGVPESMIAPAMRYIDFALRPDIQQDWCSRLGVLPVHSDAATPALLKNCAQLPDTADDLRGILYVPERVKALHQLSWEQQFQNIFAHQTGGIYGATGSS